MSEKQPKQKEKKKFNWRRTLITTVAAGLIFLFGVSVGTGRVSFGPNAAFTRSLNGKLPSSLDYNAVDEVYRSLKQNYDGQLDTSKLTDGLKEGLTKAAGDPYTEFFNPTAAKDFDGELNGTFTGIGAELSKDKNTIVVVSPIAGFPADKAGLKPKDIIAEINGKTAYDIGVSDAVSKIRGPEGTTVKLKVIRGNQELNLDITRAKITIPSVEYKVVKGNIGYIKISRFGEDTAELVNQAATELRAQSVKGIVLDLRNDPGGLLDAAVSVSSHWLPAGKKVLDEKRGGVVVRSYTSAGTHDLVGVPTVVLINEGSASASEITAGALKDNGAAVLIGQKSFGKGSVQQLVKLSSGSVLKVTIARWYTPAGKNIDKEGITPDQKVDRTDDDYKNNRDPQLDAATTQLSR